MVYCYSQFCGLLGLDNLSVDLHVCVLSGVTGLTIPFYFLYWVLGPW